MSIVNLPAVTDIESRDSSLDKDTKILNGYVEVVNKEKTLLLKRPGIDEVLTMASPAAPQLMVKYLNMLFFVMDSNLYYNNQTYALGDSAVCDSVSSYAGSNGGIIDTSTYAVTTYAPWSATTTYTAGQFIVYGLYVYWSLVDDNTGNDPSDATKWYQVAPDEMVGTTWNPATVYDTGDSAIINNVTVWSTVDGNQANIPDATQDTDVWTLLAPLTVTASNDSKVYDGLPYSGGNGVTYAGFIDGDDSGDLGGALAYGGTAQGATEVGTYSIIPSGYTSAKYEISYVAGTLSITPAITYATWNPLTSNATLSNGNLTAHNNFDAGGISRATIAPSTGRWYWEITCNSVVSPTPFNGLGIYADSLISALFYLYDTGTGQSLVATGGGEGWDAAVIVPDVSAPTTNDVFSFAVDADAGTISIKLRGIEYLTYSFGAPITFLPAIYQENATVTANFGQSAFVYSVPEGYNSGVYTE